MGGGLPLALKVREISCAVNSLASLCLPVKNRCTLWVASSADSSSERNFLFSCKPLNTFSHPDKSNTPVPCRAPRTSLRRDRFKLLFGILLRLLPFFCGGADGNSGWRFRVGRFGFCGHRIRLLRYGGSWCFRRGLRLLLCWRSLFRLQLGRRRGVRRLFVTRNFFSVPAGDHRAHVV